MKHNQLEPPSRLHRWALQISWNEASWDVKQADPATARQAGEAFYRIITLDNDWTQFDLRLADLTINKDKVVDGRSLQ